MANETLIPPPSIGESRPGEGKALGGNGNRKKGSKLWLVVLACVVVGVGLGVLVYQQSIAPTPIPSSTPRPTAAPTAAPTLLPSPTPVVPEISQVTPQSNTISFPKAGEVRVYFSNYDGTTNALVDLENSTDGVGKTIAGNGSLTTMAYVDTGLVLSGADQVTVAIYDQADYAKEAYGWIPPTADNKCGGTGAGALGDITAFKNYVTSQAEGEPIVSVQCWGDWGESGDPSNLDYNDYVVILSYNPGETTITDTVDEDEEELDEDEESTGGTSTTTTTSPSPSPSVSPSPTASASVAASPRAAQPAGSALPEAGVFEVTVGTMGIGLLLLALGVVGLLVL